MKATKISCITLNYPGEGWMLIEFTDGSSYMCPQEPDSETAKLAFGIVGRFMQAKEMFNL